MQRDAFDEQLSSLKKEAQQLQAETTETHVQLKAAQQLRTDAQVACLPLLLVLVLANLSGTAAAFPHSPCMETFCFSSMSACWPPHLPSFYLWIASFCRNCWLTACPSALLFFRTQQQPSHCHLRLCCLFQTIMAVCSGQREEAGCQVGGGRGSSPSFAYRARHSVSEATAAGEISASFLVEQHQMGLGAKMAF